MFYNTKDAVLKRKDNSKKGKIDDEIRPLLTLLNSYPQYYTTSSCAGRIVLFVEPKSGLKKDSEWLYVSHKKAELTEVLEHLDDLPDELVWLRMEPFIIHLAVEKLEQAGKLLEILTSSGLKHSGILSISKRIMVEIVGNERMDAPVAKNGRLLVDKKYLEELVNEANKKLVKNIERLHILHEKLR